MDDIVASRSHDPEPLLTPAEIASMFRVDPKTVTRWAKAGKLSAIRTLGGHRRYRESEVRALLAEQIPHVRASAGAAESHAHTEATGAVPAPAPRRGESVETPSVQRSTLPPDQATLTLWVYLDTDQMIIAQDVVQAIYEMLVCLGYREPYDAELTRGSILWRARSKAKDFLGSQELANRLVKMERILELRYLDQQQADVDVKEAQAVGHLMAALSDVPQACIRIGSLLLIKYVDGGHVTLITRTLSQLEIRALDEFPEIQRNPRKTLDALATASATLR